ncbi:NAD(P)-binding protein [Macroventuria anomochaeta]|uniref:NAD(P)-binding protein n=1 Tax=Macroventuria anomochaeta TaxID=301207 RepID=A0ACB6S4Z6_9PLEO|nr:NAD(P)-binding protein [Macroventuria anomochaeta]KAF2629251.1 NAD(P)-binding protein [Macroventuria anomochaeta]
MPTNAAKNLHGKTVLITGASSGIGRSCAFEFARTSPASLKLILTARRKDRLHQISKQIKEEVGDGVKVHVVKLDVSQRSEITQLFQNLPDDFADVQILVNNAGFMSGYERAPDIPPSIIDDVWATNVTGLIHMTQEFLKIAKKRPEGERGDVVMIGSIAGREAYAGGSIYCASKAAVRSFTEALRKELIATRIRVITVDPGQVLTEFTVVRNRGDETSADKVYEGCDPLTPDDIAEVVVFAASRRENVVVADSMLFPNYQASALDIYRKL